MGFWASVASGFVIKTTQLRVYLPVGASSPELPEAARVDVAPFRAIYGIIGESMSDDAIVAEWNGRTYICPRTPRLRVLEGVLAIRRAYRQLGTASVIPEDIAQAARRELEALKEHDPDVRAHILTSAWHVPLRWFVPFDPGAKEVLGDARGSTVRYRVIHSEAMRRLGRALEILGDTDIPDSITAEVAELHTWLEDFPPDAMVELDYGSVADLFTETELVMDDSVGDVWASLHALETGDWDVASDRYATIITRWSAPMAVGYSN